MPSFMRWLFASAWLLFSVPAPAALTVTIGDKAVDRILVLKSERRLQLMHRDEVLRAYRVSLGKQPLGTKLREGDQRTPEGFYRIDWRRPSQNYVLSMHISYPNTADMERSHAAGVPPGSMIMLHGTPLDEEYPEWFFHTLDWTNGCIALKNDDMREVWALVKDGTLIEIRP